MFPAKLQQVSCRWCNFIRISGSPLPSCIFCSFFRSLYLSMSFSQPVCFVLLFQQSFSSSLPEVWPSTDLFGSPYLSYSLSLSLYLFLPFLVPRLPVVLSRGTFPPTESRRVIYLIFEIQPVLFSSMGLHTLRWLARLPSSRGSRAILRLPWDERDTGMIANQRVRLEREREREKEREKKRERKRERVGWVSGTTRWKDLRQGVCVTHRI